MSVNITLCNPNSDQSSVLLLIPSFPISEEDIGSITASFDDEFKTYVFSGELPRVDRVWEFATEIEAELKNLKLKRITLLGVGEGANVAQAIGVQATKLIRRVILVDPVTRIKPSLAVRCIDRLENILPLGLPLRKLSKDFDSRSILHRLRCPILVLISPDADSFTQAQSKAVASRTPNSWQKQLSQPLRKGSSKGVGNFSQEFIELLAEFSTVPTKRPQKNLK